MNRELSLPLHATAVTASRSNLWLRQIGIALAGSALVAVGAHLSLPLFFTPVPLSLAPLAVLLLGLALSPRLAAASLATYLAEGACGLPVFVPMPMLPGGFARLMGPTGGYLLAYPLAAYLVSLLWHRLSQGQRTGRSFSVAIASAALGNLTILSFGALWLGFLTHLSGTRILTLAVLPFLPGDALKIIVAASVACGLQRLRRQAE